MSHATDIEEVLTQGALTGFVTFGLVLVLFVVVLIVERVRK